MIRHIAKLFVLSVATILLITPPQTASAVSASDWRAGNILDDYTFTRTDDMDVVSIQRWLDGRISCDIYGTKPSSFGGGTRAQYGASQGNPAPFTCLNMYYEVPKLAPSAGIPVNNYSKFNPNGTPVIPAGSKSAAQLIFDAAQRYSISPKVLLVKLATESPGPLTSDEWPFQRQFYYAMGAHCPDSGPNGAANCDSNYAGFSIQISEAAKLLRGYLDNMTQPWWTLKKPYQTNHILWNVVQRGCGGQDVYLDSKATAALYTYTPYQPNKAALDNMYGTGDYCSAYGNRNFWRVFRDWFGTGADYSWQVVDQAAYLDTTRTKRIGYYPSVLPGQKIHMRITAKNTGSLPWDSMTRVVTTNPVARGSTFYDATDWLSPNRPATPREGIVKPSQIGTFDFTMIAPPSFGTYRERFNLVQDGVKLFPDVGQNYTIDVTKSFSGQRTATRGFGVGSRLNTGEFILSADGNVALYLKRDGNLVILNGFRQIWSTGTAGNPGSTLVLQGDGNLVLYSKTMVPLWNSETPGSRSHSLNLQSDSNLVLYSPGGATWSSNTTTYQSQYDIVNPRMLNGGIMLPGQRLEIANRQAYLLLQDDGNLVLYNKDQRALWSSQTQRKVVKYLTMQPDGNLVLYGAEDMPLWNSRTAGNGGSRLLLQDDLNLVVYCDDGRATWATYTNR